MHDVRRMCGRSYDLGILAFLAGVVLLLIPDDWSGPRIAGVVIASLAFGGELWWTLANCVEALPHPVVRDSDPASFKDKIAPLDAVGQAAALGAAQAESPTAKDTGEQCGSYGRIWRMCQQGRQLGTGARLWRICQQSKKRAPQTQAPAGPPERTEDADDGCPEDPCVKTPDYIYAVSVAWVIVLVAAFVLFERWDWFADAVQFKVGQLPFEAIWFGALGGLLISLQGIFDHNRKWRDSYNYWHIMRPVLGAIMGTTGCLIFIVITEAATKEPSPVKPIFYDVIALAIGYREDSFRALLKRLLDTIILPAPADGTTSTEKEAAGAGASATGKNA